MSNLSGRRLTRPCKSILRPICIDAALKVGPHQRQFNARVHFKTCIKNITL